jgi:hypothetical protein
MKVGDLVRMLPFGAGITWQRIGLVLGCTRDNTVLVFWGEDFPHEEEYREQLEVVT